MSLTCKTCFIIKVRSTSLFGRSNLKDTVKGIDSETHIWPCTYSFRCYSTCYKSNSTDLPHNKYTIIV